VPPNKSLRFSPYRELLKSFSRLVANLIMPAASAQPGGG
jgi:hypothetical protein